MQLNSTIRKWVLDIRFWIVLLFIIRLYGITNPPIETSHNWRQSLTCMIARNFYESGPDLMHPVIDMAGDQSGIIGSEFPLFNYGIFLIAKIFGYASWYGRILNLIVTSIGIYLFFKIIRKYFTASIAFSATILLLVSGWFAFSRKVMPDTFSVALVITGLYCLSEYFDKRSNVYLFLYALFCTAGILCKIPAMILLSFIIIPLIHPGIGLSQKIKIVLATCLLIIPVFYWYFYHVPSIILNGGFQLYFPKNITEGLHEIAPLIPQLLEKFYFSALNSYIAFACFLAGIFFLFKNNTKLFNFALVICFVVFCIFIIKTGSVFPLHNYYIIPFTPVMALIAGIAISYLTKKWQHVVLLLILAEGISNQQHDFHIREKDKYKLTLENIIADNVKTNQLIVMCADMSPQQLYFAHRKGWIFSQDNLPDVGQLNKLTLKGAEILVVDKNKIQNYLPSFPILYNGSDYAIYSLEKIDN